MVFISVKLVSMKKKGHFCEFANYVKSFLEPLYYLMLLQGKILLLNYTFLHPKWNFEQAKWKYEQARWNLKKQKILIKIATYNHN